VQLFRRPEFRSRATLQPTASALGVCRSSARLPRTPLHAPSRQNHARPVREFVRQRDAVVDEVIKVLKALRAPASPLKLSGN